MKEQTLNKANEMKLKLKQDEEGYQNSDDVKRCPKCGSQALLFYNNGTCQCFSCECIFGVFEDGE